MHQSFSEFRPKDWYKVEFAGYGIWRIYEGHISESYGCNIWLIKGRDGVLLFDTGFGFVSLRRFLKEKTSKRVVVVASHGHCDHIGGAHEFANCCVHNHEAEILIDPNPEATVYADYACSEMFSVQIDPFQIQTHRIQAAPPTRLLADGDVIDLGDRAFNVIHVPGHSPGSIMLYDSRQRILFSGDAIHNGANGIGRYIAYHSNLHDYLNSCERVLDLPVDICHGGHFKSFDGRRYHEIVLEFLHRHEYCGCPKPRKDIYR